MAARVLALAQWLAIIAFIPVLLPALPIKFGGLYVYREVGSVGDRFKPLHNDLADEQFCSRFTNATSVVNGEEGAICLCDERSPIFDQATGSCKSHFVDNDACNTSIHFRSAHDATYFETHRLFLPLLSQTVNPNYQLDWAGAGVPRDQLGWVNCRVGQTSTLLESGGWMATSPPLRPDIFRLVNDSTSTKLKYFGDDAVSSYLNGKQVTLTVHCPRSTPLPFYCIQFSVHGRDQGHSILRSLSASPSASSPSPSQPHSESAVATAPDGGIGSRPSDVVAIICAILLLLTLVGTAMLWVICWRYHKDKLARRIQMQMIYQQRIQASQIYNDFARNNQAYFTGLDIQMQQGGMEQVIDTGVVPSGSGAHSDERYALQHDAPIQTADGQLVNPPPPYPVKKKLFFSPEFFEPEMMETPPPVAEEFLYEVRRMIDMAKARIRTRRYLPHLGDIPEEVSSNCSESADSRRTSTTAEAEMTGETSMELELTCSMSSGHDVDADDMNMDSSGHTPPAVAANRQQTSSPGHSSGDSQPTSSDSHDSGFASPSKAENIQKEDKVQHWLDKLPEEIELTSSKLSELGGGGTSAGAIPSASLPDPDDDCLPPCPNSSHIRPASPTCSDADTSTTTSSGGRKPSSSDGSNSNSAASSHRSSGGEEPQVHNNGSLYGCRNGGGLLKYLQSSRQNGFHHEGGLPPVRDGPASFKSSALLKRYGIGPTDDFPTLKTNMSNTPCSGQNGTVGRGTLGRPAKEPAAEGTLPLVSRTLGSQPIYRPVF